MGSHDPSPLLAFDEKAKGGHVKWIAGIDEAGRGPLAGPVVAAAVILFRRSSLNGLNDSKKVAPFRRLQLYQEIIRHSIVGLGIAGEREIDALNIYQASRLAMKRAVHALARTPDLLLIDGNLKLDVPLSQKPVIGGDRLSASIAAASILAKVYRDAWMTDLDRFYPEYGFKFHKGYPTPDHLKRLKEAGPSAVHRKSFAPVREALGMTEKCKYDETTTP